MSSPDAKSRIDSAGAKLASATRDRFASLIEQKTAGAHTDFLIEKLASPINLTELFQYGVERLPVGSARPDYALSSYFFILSEITGLDDKVRSFAMDSMMYCEADQFSSAASHTQLLVRYQKIQPLLTEKGL